RVKRLRADKKAEFIGNEFKGYYRQTGVVPQYTSTSTSQSIGLSERVGRTLAVMVWCMLADSDLQTFLGGKLMLMGAYLTNNAPHTALVCNLRTRFYRG
ncbi:unnamed protein product, partial [Sphacelaria rigidula]